MGLSSTAKSFINNICNSHRDPGTTWIQTMTFSGFVVELLLVTMSPKNSCSSSNIRFFYWNFLVCYEQALCTPFYVLSQDVVKSFLKVIGCIRKAKRSLLNPKFPLLTAKYLFSLSGSTRIILCQPDFRYQECDIWHVVLVGTGSLAHIFFVHNPNVIIAPPYWRNRALLLYMDTARHKLSHQSLFW